MAAKKKTNKKTSNKEDNDIDIGTINLTDLNPSENATRKIDDEGLKVLEKSMSSFGLVEPIIVNIKDGVNRIISGHQRYDVLLNQFIEGDLNSEEMNIIKLGDLGWVFKDTNLQLDDEDKETQLSIAMNKHQGKFIKTKLQETLKELELKGLDIELTGFKKVELQKLDSKLPKKDKDKEKKSEVDKTTIEVADRPVKKLAICPKCSHEFEV